ncbi:MAG: prepilin peptidase [Patescibacteria group bacterium]
MNFLQPLFIIALFLLGSALGSFISVISYRLHSKKTGIITGRSQCPDCEAPLQTRDLIPLISYLYLRGKCRHCNKEISYLYPLLEIISGFLFVTLFFKFPFIDDALNVNGNFIFLYALWGFYTFILIFTFLHDLRYFKTSDQILIPGILVGLIATFSSLTPHLIDSLLGLGIAVTFFGLQIAISKGRWLGGGDLRVGALMGVILGWKLTVLALIVAYMTGSVVGVTVAIKKGHIRDVKIPFAPFLVVGTFIAFYYGDVILGWYLNYLNIS